jgi:hypothetical protein
MFHMRRALIVGINDYPHAPLYGCVNDAATITQALSRNYDGLCQFSMQEIGISSLQPHESLFA